MKDEICRENEPRLRRQSHYLMFLGTAMIAVCLWAGMEHPEYLGTPLMWSVLTTASGAGKYSLDNVQMRKSQVT